MMFGDTRGYFGSLYTEGLYSSPQEVQRAQTQSAQNQARSREIDSLKKKLGERGNALPGSALSIARGYSNRGLSVEEDMKELTKVYDQLRQYGVDVESDENLFNPYEYIDKVNEAAASFSSGGVTYTGGVGGQARGPGFQDAAGLFDRRFRVDSALGLGGFNTRTGQQPGTHGSRTPGALAPTPSLQTVEQTRTSGLNRLAGWGGRRTSR